MKCSRRLGTIALLAGSALLLQGCVAAMLPLAAAGVIGKKEIDKARARAKRAEASFVPEVVSPIVTVGDQPATLPAPPALAQSPLVRPGSSNTLTPFASYAIEQAEKRRLGEPVQSVVLVEKVSLADPQTMSCDNKPVLAVIDLDNAPDAFAVTDLSDTLQIMRSNDVRIAWVADADEAQLKPLLDGLRAGHVPALRESDLILFGQTGGVRKQEHRWQLARDHCVVAIAGDRRADFDELYDYLRDPAFAIRLEPMFGKGWFELNQTMSPTDGSPPKPRAKLDPSTKSD